MDFEVLRDLVQIITRNKVKKIEVLGNPGQEASRTEQLYDGIAKGKFNSDEEAAQKLLNTDAKDSNYRKIRHRLMRQLVNTAFFIDLQQSLFTERNTAYVNCYRDFAAAQILLGRGASKAGAYILHQVLEQTIKFEFTELTAEVARVLRRQYARALGDRPQHQYFTQLHQQYEEKRRWEITAWDYHEQLIDHYITKRSPNEDVHRLANTYFKELFDIAPKIDTFQFYYYTYQIGIIKFFSVNDCINALLLSNAALDILQSRKNAANRPALFSTAMQKLVCLTQLRIFDEGRKTAEYCLEMTDEGSFNWFKVMEHYFYHQLYAHRYPEALALFTQAIQHPRFQFLSNNVQDEWQLFGGYLHLLAALGQLPAAEVEKTAGPIKIGQFTGEYKVLDKDKEGMNIPLIMLPVLFNLAAGNDLEYGRTVEALEKYRIRYLNNNLNRRSASFMKMLFALSERPFRQAAADRKIAKEQAVLEAEKPQVAGQTFAVEIIPYEDLWNLLEQKQNGPGSPAAK